MNIPTRKIPNAYHNSLIVLKPRFQDREFRDLPSNPEALKRICQIREDYDVNTFIDISILVPICATCKQSADRKVKEILLPEVDFPDWQLKYESFGITRAIIVMMEEQISKKNWESLFCFSCQSNIYFPKPFLTPRTNNFFIYSSPILKYYSCQSSSGKQPRPWMKEVLIRIYGEKCLACNQRFGKEFLTFDHIIPESQGGEANFVNLQLLCQKCNSEKDSTSPKIIISHITAELFPPEVDCNLSESEKRIDNSGDDVSHPLAHFFYKID